MACRSRVVGQPGQGHEDWHQSRIRKVGSHQEPKENLDDISGHVMGLEINQVNIYSNRTKAHR